MKFDIYNFAKLCKEVLSNQLNYSEEDTLHLSEKYIEAYRKHLRSAFKQEEKYKEKSKTNV